MSEEVQDLITGAVRLWGGAVAGEVLNTSELTVGLLVLNNLIDELNADRLNVYGVAPSPFNLVSGTAAYQIGPAATFNITPRPIGIQTANIIMANGVREPLVILNASDWSAIQDQAATSIRPLYVYIDNNWPVATISLWPAPAFSGSASLELYVWMQLTQFTTVTQAISFPPAYEEMLRYNLAVRLVNEYYDRDGAKARLPAWVAERADASLQAVRETNNRLTETGLNRPASQLIPSVRPPMAPRASSQPNAPVPPAVAPGEGA